MKIPSFTMEQIKNLYIDKGFTFGKLTGGPLHGQNWLLKNEISDEIEFYTIDPYTKAEYVTIYKKIKIYALGVWEFYFTEMYPYIEDTENQDPRGLYGQE